MAWAKWIFSMMHWAAWLAWANLLVFLPFACFVHPGADALTSFGIIAGLFWFCAGLLNLILFFKLLFGDRRRQDKNLKEIQALGHDILDFFGGWWNSRPGKDNG